MMDFENSKDKVVMGLERKSKVITEDEKKTTAYHEAGHALVARFLPDAMAVNKVTIIPRGRAAGITWYLPDESDFKYKGQLENGLSSAFGGRVAEELIFNKISTGASSDIKHATSIANRMVRVFGMSENLVPMSYEQHDDNIFIGREMTQAREYSEDTARKIDAEVSIIITRAYKQAQEILKDNIDILHALAKLLIEKETVMGKELDELVVSMRPDFKFFERDKKKEEPEVNSKPEVESEDKDHDDKDMKLDIDNKDNA
jgi:cell division protease FtsH